MYTCTLIFLLCTFNFNYVKSNNVLNVRDVGEPLFLTPLIESNKIYEARNAAKVDPKLFHNIQSYSGYLTVDKRFHSNLFFWFFPAQENYQQAPVLLWLQGGPGASSLYALFEENGPFYLKASNKLELNQHSWAKKHSVIYIDNPVQTGYSFTKGGFAKNQTKVGEDLYQALKQFFTLFPELQHNDFFVTGESYGGKYVPAIAYKILMMNPSTNLKINLKGITIGNGLCDPEYQVEIHDHVYQLGLIDSNGRQKFINMEQKVIYYIRKKQFDKAFRVFDDLLNGDFNGGNTLFKNLTGFTNYFNFLNAYSDRSKEPVSYFIQQEHIRKAIHVGNLTFNNGVETEKNLLSDIMDSVAPWISEILNHIRVLFYNGQLDLIVPYTSTVNFIRNLNFSAANEYKTAARHFWSDDKEIAWYVKEAGNLTEVMVRNSGHMVPTDQPAWALNLISRFVRNQPLWNK